MEALLKLFHVEHKYKFLTLSARLAAAAQMLWWWSFPPGQAFYNTLRIACSFKQEYISYLEVFLGFCSYGASLMTTLSKFPL